MAYVLTQLQLSRLAEERHSLVDALGHLEEAFDCLATISYPDYPSATVYDPIPPMERLIGQEGARYRLEAFRTRD